MWNVQDTFRCITHHVHKNPPIKLNLRPLQYKNKKTLTSASFSWYNETVSQCLLACLINCFECFQPLKCLSHYDDDILGAIASQITSLTIFYSTVYSDADQIKHQSSASLAFATWIDRGPVNSPHKWPVTRKMFPFDDVIMAFRGHNDTSVARIILDMCSANERRRYNVTLSLFCWVHTQNNPYLVTFEIIDCQRKCYQNVIVHH